MTLHERRFPNETEEYRQARDTLLEAEMKLRRQVEAVAELRRGLPLGGRLPEDYEFIARDGTVVRFSELFRGNRNSLLVYNFMFPPGGRPCPMCTSMLDSLDGTVPHLVQQTNLAVVARAPIAEINEFAQQRGWARLPLLSSNANSYNRDYHGETAQGQWPMLNVFRRRGPEIFHSWGSELMFTRAEPGQNQRHVDMIWPLWNLLDLTREGRGDNWFPQLSYD